MKTFFPAILLSFAIFLISCGNEAPPEWGQKGPYSTLLIPLSYYEVPIEYPLESFQQWLNEKIQGTFFSKSLPVNGGDSLNLEITKLSDISIELRNEKLHVTVPVAIKGIYQKEVAGIQVKNRTPLEAELVIQFESAVNIDQDWDLITKSELKSIKWTKNPTLKVLGLKVDLKKIIDENIMKRAPELAEKFDQAIHKKVSLRKPMEKVWHDLQKPIFLHKYHPQAWMKILGEKVYGKLDMTRTDALVFHIKVEGRNYAVLDSLTLPESTKLPKLQPLNRKADSFYIVIHGEIPFELANDILNEKLKNQKIEKGGYSLTIARIEMKGTDSGLIVRVKVKGDIRGNLYLVGKPVFDPVTQKLKVENFRFMVETSDNLVNAADAVLHDALIGYLDDYLEFDLLGPISTVPDLIHQGIEKGKAGKRFDLNISALDISKWRLQLNEKNLQFQIDTRGKATIEIEKLKVKSRVNIQ